MVPTVIVMDCVVHLQSPLTLWERGGATVGVMECPGASAPGCGNCSRLR